ncbi:MAG: hypothetical protein AAGB22_05375, partial [Bacteroidota bacterium]
SPKGLCYQPTNDVDPISDDNLSTITALVADGGDWNVLGINAIRVYQVDPDKSHDQVMKLLKDSGIYVMIGCVNSSVAMPRDGSYPCAVLDRCKAVVDAFKGYDNLLAFSVSNEVLDSPGQQSTAAAVKALVRDTKAYIASNASRAIPVGLAMRDVRSYTWPAAKYYTCGATTDRVDFIAYNVYVWCAPQDATNFTGQIDAYYKLYDFFKEFPVPVFWGEHGCMNQGIREWKQIPYLYGAKEIYSAPSPGTKYNMADVISGGFAFRYIMHSEGFGLVLPDGGGKTPDGGFDQLASEYASVTDFSGTPAGSPNSGDAKDCSTWTESGFNPTIHGACGSGGGVPTTGTKVTVKNDIEPANEIKLLVHLDTDPDSTWHTILDMEAGAPPVETTIPTGTEKIMMIYNADNWPMGCQITDMSLITAGCTISATWVAPDGTGTCPVS